MAPAGRACRRVVGGPLAAFAQRRTRKLAAIGGHRAVPRGRSVCRQRRRSVGVAMGVGLLFSRRLGGDLGADAAGSRVCEGPHERRSRSKRIVDRTWRLTGDNRTADPRPDDCCRVLSVRRREAGRANRQYFLPATRPEHLLPRAADDRHPLHGRPRSARVVERLCVLRRTGRRTGRCTRIFPRRRVGARGRSASPSWSRSCN